MASFKELIKLQHIQIVLATDVGIIVMAYFSKRILPLQIGYLQLAVPSFIDGISEGFAS